MRQSVPEDPPKLDNGKPRPDMPDTRAAKPSRHLAIIDPSPLRRDYLKAGLTGEARLWHVDVVASITDLVRMVRQGHGFTVILLGGPTVSAFDPLDLSRISAMAPQTPVLVTADCDDPEQARLILRSGAKGFLPTSLGLKALVTALERLRSGGTFVPIIPSGTRREPAPSESPGPPWQKMLTRRQRDVLELISQGKSNKLIAAALNMSESTVKAHVKQIMRRLQATNRTQAALIVTQSQGRTALAAPAEDLPRHATQPRQRNLAEIGMPPLDPDFFLAKADGCRQLLQITTEPKVKQQLRIWEQEFDQIADQLKRKSCAGSASDPSRS